MKTLNIVLLIITLVLAFQAWAEAQIVLKGSVVGNGGAPMEGGGMRLNGTLGQPAIGVSSNASNGMFAGFWYLVTPPSEEVPEIGINPTSFSFYSPSGGPNPTSKKLNITNTGDGTLSWSVSDNAAWLSLNPGGGTCTNETDEVSLSVNVFGLANGVYNANVTVTAPGASNTPQILPVKLTVGSVAFQRQLKEGWNHISFPINQCFYTGAEPADQPSCVEKINVSSFGSLSAWFSSVTTPSSAWKMVIGQKGAMDSGLSTVFHSLKYMSPISGYWVNIKAGTGGAVLSMTGPPFDPACAIPLQTGWNQVGFPLDNGYYDSANPPTNMPWITNWQPVSPPVTDYVFNSIEGQFDMVIGEFGAYNPVSPASSSLHNIASGCGYWIRVKENVNLKYSDMGISALAAPRKK